MNYILIILLATVVTVPFLSYLNKQSNKKPLVEQHVFRMPKVYLYMGYLMILIAMMILILPRLMKNAPAYYHPVVWIVIAAIFLFGIYIICVYMAHKVIIDQNEFTIYSSFGNKKTFEIASITSLNISIVTYFITVKDQDGQKGKIYFHLKGLIQLLRQIQSASGRDILDIERLLKR